MEMDSDFLLGLFESVLFASGDPVNLKEFYRILPEQTADEFEKQLPMIIESINSRIGGLEIVAVGGGYQLVTRPTFASYIQRLNTVQTKRKLSRAACEVLAIIAYRQPITQPEIDYIRGVDCSGVIHNLIEKKLIDIIGKKNAPGHPHLYGTTDKFLTQFGLKDLDALPELHILEEWVRESPQQELFPDPDPEDPENLRTPENMGMEVEHAENI